VLPDFPDDWRSGRALPEAARSDALESKPEPVCAREVQRISLAADLILHAPSDSRLVSWQTIGPDRSQASVWRRGRRSRPSWGDCATGATPRAPVQAPCLRRLSLRHKPKTRWLFARPGELDLSIVEPFEEEVRQATLGTASSPRLGQTATNEIGVERFS
jgi:hypothetical protein